jgi:hypothetical protein
VGVSSDDDARAEIVEGLNSSALTMEDKRAMARAWLCRDITGMATAKANPLVPLGVRVLIKNGRVEGW